MKMSLSRSLRLLLLGWLLVLGGCGQKGDLTLPDAAQASLTAAADYYLRAV